MKIEIIICCENGYLESMSKLLIFSIREFGGIISDSQIYCYKPRKGDPLENTTLDFFEKNQVNYFDDPININYDEYALANKPYSCAHREYNSNADLLIFIDSDTYFLGSPNIFNDLSEGELFLRPVHSINIGSNIDFSNINGSYWRKLYAELGVASHRTVMTTISNKEIMEYYNSGLIVTTPTNNLFMNWKENFEKIMKLGLKPSSGIFFVEQSVFGATVSALKLKVRQLDKRYNCPLYGIDRFKNPAYIINDFSELIHVHYHSMYKNRMGNNPYYEKFAEFDNGITMNEKLREFDVIIKNSTVTNISNLISKIIVKILNSLNPRKRI